MVKFNIEMLAGICDLFLYCKNIELEIAYLSRKSVVIRKTLW